MSPKEKLAVIVPALNEEHTLGATVASLMTVVPELPFETRVILIDDGSTDGTRRVMDELRAKYGCEVVSNPRNLGLGRSVMNAWDMVEPGSWVTVQPGDNEFEFASIKNLVEVRGKYDVVLGYLGNPVVRPLSRRLMSVAFTKTAATLYGFDFRYLNGMKLYRVDAFRGIEVKSGGHAFNAELLAKAILRNPHLRIGQAPFLSRGRSAGNSKAVRPKNVFRAIREVAAGWRSVGEYRQEKATRRD